jgi:hypothetical protein
MQLQKARSLLRMPLVVCGGQLLSFSQFSRNAYECFLLLQHSGLPYMNGGPNVHTSMLCVLH